MAGTWPIQVIWFQLWVQIKRLDMHIEKLGDLLEQSGSRPDFKHALGVQPRDFVKLMPDAVPAPFVHVALEIVMRLVDLLLCFHALPSRFTELPFPDTNAI